MSAPATTRLGNPATGLQPVQAIPSGVREDVRGRKKGEETDQERQARKERERLARRHRYERRDQLRPLRSIDRLRGCGATSVSGGGVTVGLAQNTDGTQHAGYGGVATCGSVWSCPQCAAVVATRRADELADVMRAVDLLGGCAYMLTLTMQHRAGDRLGWNRDQRRRWESLETCRKRRTREGKAPELNVGKVVHAEHWTGGTPGSDGPQTEHTGHVCDVDAEQAERTDLLALAGCWDAVGEGWKAVTSGGTWVKDQKRHGGFLGWARVIEVTDGANGWHVHVHALLCWPEDVAEHDARAIAERMFRRWKAALEKRGFDASGDLGPDGRIPGWDLRRAQLGDGDLAHYFTKLAHEITSGHRKEGRRPGGRTPMQLAADAVETYRDRDVARWWEWENASEGRRQLTWSGKDGAHDLRKLAGLAPERTDEQIAAEEIPADDRLGLSAEVWGWVRASDQVTVVLDVAEVRGLDGLRRWLTSHGQDVVQGVGAGWLTPPEHTLTVGSGGISFRIPAPGPIPRNQGTGRGWIEAPPAVLRPRDPQGRPLRRPSDRPPRWSDDAAQALHQDH